ncbi:ribosome maturation factor RimP [Asanoa siamensis]|uniref:ribosome maturation factor RimP n=1 Tax=Asanoa siamensis TaxID=926357 RepID=UPI001944F942|nr:ribosome maturation factor RimP [Asanoa siamensis]
MAQRSRAAGGRPAPGPRPAAPRGDLAARRARLRTVVEPVVGDAGYDLEDLNISRAGRRFVVRVVVDRDGGLDLDAVADVSRAVSAALDTAEEGGDELVAGEYQLEVSSPGVDRPLTLPRHWRRNIGRLVKVGPLTGRVVGVDDAGVMLDVAGERTAIAHADLGPGRVQVEFSRIDEVADDELTEFADDEDADENEDGLEDEER